MRFIILAILKNMVSETLIGREVKQIVTCNTCRVVISEDKGSQLDVPLMITRINSHISTPGACLGLGNHEILTVNMRDGSYVKGLNLVKKYSD